MALFPPKRMRLTPISSESRQLIVTLILYMEICMKNVLSNYLHLIKLILIKIFNRFRVTSFAILCVGVILLPSVSPAAISIPVANGDFEAVANDDEEAPLLGLLGSYDRVFGAGPWSASGTGVATLLGAPEVEIGSGVATVRSLASLNVGGLISNQARIYQDDISSSFVTDYTYTLSVEVTTANLITVDLLSDVGIRVGLLANGTSTPTAGSPGVLLDLDILSSNSGLLTYTMTAGAGLSGQSIGVEMVVGDGGPLADVGAFGAITFDNVTLSAVPEPSAYGAILGGLILTVVAFRRKGPRAVSGKSNEKEGV